MENSDPQLCPNTTELANKPGTLIRQNTALVYMSISEQDLYLASRFNVSAHTAGQETSLTATRPIMAG